MKNKFIIFFLLVLSYNVYGQSVSLSTSSVTLGGTVTVTWSGFSGTVNVCVYRGSETSPWQYATTTGTGSSSQNLVTIGWDIRSDYYIRVELKSNINIYRTTGNFSVTSLPPSIPTLTYPTNGATLNDNTPDFAWTANNASYFDIQVASSSSFSSILRENTSCYTLNWTPSTMSDGTYYWRVKSFGTNGVSSAWSSTYSFTIQTIQPPSIPTLTYPSNGATLNDNTPDLLWSANNASYFDVQIDNSSSFTSIDRENSSCYTLNWTPSTMSDGTYYWRVRTYGLNGIWSNWSIIYSFTIQTIQPSIPILTYPSNGATLIDNTPDLAWTANNANYFDVQIDDNSSFTSIDREETACQGFVWTPSSLSDGTYYWRVRTYGYGIWSNWSETRNFTLNTTPPTYPTLIAPSGNIALGNEISFSWNSVPNAARYRIKICYDQNMTTQITGSPFEPSLGATNYNISANSFTSGQTYYWQVSSILPNDVGGWGNFGPSPPQSFKPMQIQSVNLISPTLNTTITSSEINFSWSAIPTATSYELYVDNNSGLGSPEISPTIPELKNLTATQFTISANWLTPGNTYYWKVIAKTPTGDVSSTVGNFKYSPTLSSSAQWVPVYRTYNKTVIDHFYCTASNHLQTAVDNGFKYEKNEGYVSLIPFQTNDLKCIYRLYKSDITNPKASFHYYTTDDSERDLKIISGWMYEGITGYCYGNYHTNSVKLFHVELNQISPDIRIDHFYTTSEIEKNNAILKQSYIDRGFIGYVSLDGDQPTVPRMESQPEVGSGINPMNGSLSSVQKTSFSIPEGEVGLSFTHLYNSGAINFITPYSPLGAGWNHNYNVSLMVSGGAIIVFMPTEINVYDRTTLLPITKGVYNKLIRQTEKIFRIKFKNQTEYAFEMMNDNDSTAVLTSITDRHNNVIRLIHDDYHRLISVKTLTNRSLEFTYFADADKKYLIQSIKDTLLNRTIKFDYDDNNNLIKFTDAKNQITNYNYGTTPFGLYLNSITYADGTKIINTFDTTSKRLTSQNFISNQTTHQTRVSMLTNNKATVTDENNKWIEMSYDAVGNITDLVTASGAAKYKYTDITNPTKPTEITDGKGFVTTVTYNSMGDPLTINKPLSITHQYEWNATNDLVKYTNPLNNVTNFTYTNGNLTAISTPRGTTNITYFNNGNINTVNDPLSQTITYSYDGYNNVKTISDILGNKTQYDYDAASRIIKVTDANNQITSYNYDENDLLKSTIDPLTKTTQYNYDASNRLIAVTDARGNTSSMSFNSTTGLLDYSTDQLGSKTNYTYFENRTLKSITNRNNQTLNYAYDEINRLSNISGSGISRTFTYDLNDNIVKIDDTNGSLGFTYDELNRLTSHTDFYNNKIQYAYDKAGNVTQRTYKTGKTVNYTYYADNLLYTVKDWDNRITTYTYRNDGSIDQINLPNGTYIKYSYDAAGRLIGLANKKSDGSIINSYTYTLDGVGNPINVTSNEPLTALALTTANFSYSYDKANRILNAGSTTFTHDGNGNMKSQNDNGSITSFIYDAENKLTGVSGSFVASYGYDAMGYRRSATRNGVTTRYVLDVNGSMENVLMETDESNNPIYYYIQGNGLLYRIKASDNSVQYYHYDSRGSTIAITDQNQNITHKYTYDSFGKVTNSVEADFNPYRYVGQYGVMYENSDLYFMRARYYKPEIGRFISEDPVWSVNLYAYGENNPISFIDPKGRQLEYNDWLYKMTGWVDNPNVLYNAQKGKIFFSTMLTILAPGPGTAMAAAINTLPSLFEMANGELTLQDAFKNILDLSTSFVDLKSIDMSELYKVSTKSYDYYSNFKDLSDASKK